LWIKRSTLGVQQWLLTVGGQSINGSPYGVGLVLDATDRLAVSVYADETTGRFPGALITQQPLRDPTSWYHIHVAVDTTQAIPSDRVKLAINGSTVTSFLSTNTSPSYALSSVPLNAQTIFNTPNHSPNSDVLVSGLRADYMWLGGSPGGWFNGYMTEVNYVDGQALDPIAFGRYDENGMWVPRRYNGNFGPNGFYLPFSDNSSRGALGIDANQLNSADPFWPVTVFHLQTQPGITGSNNNTFIDSSNTGATITRTGNASQGTFNPYSLFGSAAATRGGSVYFDGNSELNAGSNANFAFGTNSYTVEFWVYSTVDMNTTNYGAGTGPSFICNDATNGWCLYNNVNAGRGITLNQRSVGDIAFSGVQLPSNRWNHIAVSRSAPAGNSYAVWLNGTRILNGGDSTNWSVTGPLKIGNISTSGYTLRGYIAGLRILNNAALYDPANATITVPTAPPENSASTVFLLNGNNAAVYDATGFHNLNTLNAASVSQAQTLYGNSCLALDGSTAAACVSSNIYNNYLVNFAANDFTVESWAWLQVAPTGSAPTAIAFIASVHDNSSTSTWCLYVNTNRTITFYGAGGAGVAVTSNNTIPLQTWVHVAVVRNGDFLTIYLNGVADVTTRVAGGTYTAESIASLVIGRRYQGAAPTAVDPFNGFISDLRITRAARYLGNFTPPTQALPTTGSTQGFWPYNIQLGGHKETDSMLDVPVNWGTNNGGILSGTMRGNYATLNPINKGAGFVISNGGLDASSAASAAIWRPATATHAVSSGKWYWEVLSTAGATTTMLGVANTRWDAFTENPSVTYPGGDAALNSWGYYSGNGNSYRAGANYAYGDTFTTNDIIGFALDMDNGTFYVSKNGVWQGASNASNPVASNPSIGRNPVNQISGRTFPLTTFHFPAFGVYGGDTYSVNFGQRPFVYADGPALSAGFKPICTTNIIPPLNNPSSFFEATGYTGGTNTFNSDVNAGQLVLAMPLDSYNTYFDVSNEISSRISQPKALYTTTGVTYTSISGAAFNGTTGYIELSAHPDFDLGIAGNWTIEWYQFWNDLTGNQTVWSNNYTTAPNLLIQSQSNLGRHQLFTNGGTSILNEGNAPTPSLWYHYAVVKNGSTYTIFRNGSATGVTTYNALTNAGSTTFRSEIGRGNGAFFLKGNIRDFRIYKGLAKYTTTFNPTTATTAVVATTGTGYDKFINLGFQPDLVWVKARNIGKTSHILVDSVRGGSSTLSANSTDAATISSNNITFNQTGFNVGGSNAINASFYATGRTETFGDSVVGYRNIFTPLTGNWSRITGGQWFTFALSAGTTKLFSTGVNDVGQLGIGTTGGSINAFTALTGDWSYMVCGNSHTMAQSAGTNKWFAVGDGGSGQLGLGPGYGNPNLFTALTGSWSNMVCGDYFTMALSADTTKWFGTGTNYWGQLALGDAIPGPGYSVFTPLTGNWSQMVCGSNHTMALSAGTTKWYATGYNNRGQLGLNDNSNRNVFTPLTGDWLQMSCGPYRTMALSASNTKMFAVGYNQYGELGVSVTPGSDTNTFSQVDGDWSQVFCGYNHTLALSAGTNRLLGCGRNLQYQLGIPTGINQTSFTLPTDPTNFSPSQVALRTTSWSQVYAGYENSFAIPLITIPKTFNPQLNTPGATYTAYGWKRNVLAGFDIVRVAKANAVNESFNHGLGTPPSMMIVKGENTATGWNVYHSFANISPATVYTALESQAAPTVAAGIWNNTQPTASQFTLGTTWGAANLIAYLFAEIPGFSRFGNYTANGSVDGPFVWCGFKPRFVLTKKVNGTSDWLIWDSSRGPTNPISPHFSVNNNAADNSTTAPTYNGYIDFTATGFKLRLSSAPNEASVPASIYMFAAFADNPFGRVPGQVLAV
jgi:alpha-tubulin suppressor-like RCC1 family protein